MKIQRQKDRKMKYKGLNTAEDKHKTDSQRPQGESRFKERHSEI